MGQRRIAEYQGPRDINLAFELLAVGDQTIKAQACESIKALSTPAIPGQAREYLRELVKQGVGPTLLKSSLTMLRVP